MNRYWKDPIILLSSIAWVIAFLVLAFKMSSHSAMPLTKTTTLKTLSTTNPQRTDPNSAAGAGTSVASPTSTLTSPPIIPISRAKPGEIFVSKISTADTSDLINAIAQVKENEKIVVDVGTYDLSDIHFTTPERLVIVGSGPETIIRLHTTLFLKGVTTLEKLTLEGPTGENTLSVNGTGLLTLDDVVIRNSAYGILLNQTSKMTANKLRMEKIDSNCVSLRDDSKANITFSSFSDCFTAISSATLSTAEVMSARFEHNRIGFLISDDRNHATCVHCDFDPTIQEKANVLGRLVLTEKPSEDKK